MQNKPNPNCANKLEIEKIEKEKVGIITQTDRIFALRFMPPYSLQSLINGPNVL